MQKLLQEKLFTRITTIRIFYKYYYKNSLQGLLQKGLFANLLQGLPSLWIQAKNQSQHHAWKNNFGLIWYKNIDTNKDTQNE